MGQYTIVEGPSHYSVALSTSTAGVQLSIANTCALYGTTKAVCRQTVSGSARGTQTSTAPAEYTLNGNDFASHYATFSLTAGGDKIAKATGSCTKPWEGSKGAAMPTGITNSDVYKVIVVPAAAIVAAAMI